MFDSAGNPYVQICTANDYSGSSFNCNVPYGSTYATCTPDPPPPPPDPSGSSGSSGSSTAGSSGYSSESEKVCAIPLDTCKAKIKSTTSIDGVGWTKDLTCAMVVTPKGPSVCMNNSQPDKAAFSRCSTCSGGSEYDYNPLTGQEIISGAPMGSVSSGSGLTCTADQWSVPVSTTVNQAGLSALGLKGTCNEKKCCVSNDAEAVAKNHPFDPTGKGDCGQDQDFYDETVYASTTVTATSLSSVPNYSQNPISSRCTCKGNPVMKSSKGIGQFLAFGYGSTGVQGVHSYCDYTNIDPSIDDSGMGTNSAASSPIPTDKSAPCSAHQTKVLKCSMVWVCQDPALPIENCKCNGVKKNDQGITIPNCQVDSSSASNNTPNYTCQLVNGSLECSNNTSSTSDSNAAKTGKDECGAGYMKQALGTYMTQPSGTGIFPGTSYGAQGQDYYKCVPDPNAPANASTSKDATNFICKDDKKYIWKADAGKFVEAVDTYGCDFSGGAMVMGNKGDGIPAGSGAALQTESTAQQANAIAQQGNIISSKSASDARADASAIKSSIDALGNKLGNGLSKDDVNGDGTGNGVKGFEGGLGTTETGFAGYVDKHLNDADQAPKTSEIGSSLMGKLGGLDEIVQTGGCINPVVSSNGVVLTALSNALSKNTICEKTEWLRDVVEWILRLWLLWEAILAFNKVFSSITNTPL